MADLGEAHGKQELFTKQAPQKLNVLREHALIESAVSSNRIEGVTVDEARIRTIILGKPHLRDRNEEEVRGYRNALKFIHEQGLKMPVSKEICRARLFTFLQCNPVFNQKSGKVKGIVWSNLVNHIMKKAIK